MFTLLALGCAKPPPPPIAAQPPLHASQAPLSLALAGAPLELFGPEQAPTFTSAFTNLQDAGFDTFLPLFLVSETPEASTYTDHVVHFLPPASFGGASDSGCRGPFDPYEAAEGRVSIALPGLMLLGLQDASQPLDVPALDAQLVALRDDCLTDHPGVATWFYTYDEPVLGHIANTYVGDPALLLENLETASERSRVVLGLPTLLVEAAGGYALLNVGLRDNPAARLVAAFWEEVDGVAPTAGAFGFDVYPVPDLPLTMPGEYVRHARRVAPEARALSVLQGMAFNRISRGATPGRAPTVEETRFMALDSITSGADVLGWYGASSLDLSVAEDAALWDALRVVASELAPVRDAITGAPVVVSGPESVGARAHQTDDGIVLFVSHRSSSPATVSLEIAADVTSVSPLVGPSGALEGRLLTVALAPHDAAIYHLR